MKPSAFLSLIYNRLFSKVRSFIICVLILVFTSFIANFNPLSHRFDRNDFLANQDRAVDCNYRYDQHDGISKINQKRLTISKYHTSLIIACSGIHNNQNCAERINKNEIKFDELIALIETDFDTEYIDEMQHRIKNSITPYGFKDA